MWTKPLALIPLLFLLVINYAVAGFNSNYELKGYMLGTKYTFDDTKRNGLSPEGEYIFTQYFSNKFPHIERITEIIENNQFKGYRLHRTIDSASTVTINILRTGKNTFTIAEITYLQTLTSNYHNIALLSKLKHKYGSSKSIQNKHISNLGLSLSDMRSSDNLGRWGSETDQLGSSVTAIVITSSKSPILLVQAKSTSIKERNLQYLVATRDFVDTRETMNYKF